MKVEWRNFASGTTVDVANGKYTVLIYDDGRLKALRYGEIWQDLCGNNLVYNLAVELQELREKHKNSLEVIKILQGG